MLGFMRSDRSPFWVQLGCEFSGLSSDLSRLACRGELAGGQVAQRAVRTFLIVLSSPRFVRSQQPFLAAP
jgi:hypothetical protein